MTDQFSALQDVRVHALAKFHEQVLSYPALLAALSTENLANLLYDRERSGLTDNDVYAQEMGIRVNGLENWSKIKIEATKTSTPTWSEAIKRFGFDPEQRLRQK